MASADAAQAASADSAFRSLAAAYARQEAHKLARIAKATVRALKKAGHAVARAATAVAKAAYKYSGAQDVVSCVTHPSLAGCAKAALTVGTAGEGEVAEIGLNAAEHAGEDLAENAGTHAAADSAGSVTRVFRVEGPGNARLDISAGGDVSIKGDNMLFLNFGDEARAQEFLAQRLARGHEGTVIKSFDVPTSYANDVAARAVPESMARGSSVISVDTTKTASSYGLRSSEFPRLSARSFLGADVDPA